MTDTKDRHLLGKKFVQASVMYKIPLDDPQALGNMGLDGFDEESVGRNFPNAGLARHWVESVKPPQPDWEPEGATLYLGHWAADDFEDEVYGTILDVMPVVEQRQEASWDGSWSWDEIEDEQP